MTLWVTQHPAGTKPGSCGILRDVSVSAVPDASDSEKALPALSGQEERLAFAGTFDRLIASNLKLSASVERLVRTIYLWLGISTTVAMALGTAVLLRR
jgi:hypothetical protein